MSNEDTHSPHPKPTTRHHHSPLKAHNHSRIVDTTSPKAVQADQESGLVTKPDEIERISNIVEKFYGSPDVQKLLIQNGLSPQGAKDFAKGMGQRLRQFLRETPADALMEAESNAARHGKTLTAEERREAISNHTKSQKSLLSEVRLGVMPEY